ncbi:hypothetical protein Cantr_07966 [Candida viswanathii]|uniref:F-box domain-containing protein n=1 Tax=Candida viswanathii TaxID=5486 RepID=A0A367Y0U5_9ASCO|nr:hypothetical protein Cantr_07966 [Candida viswanathii]
MSSILCLPNELIIKVFQYLSPVETNEILEQLANVPPTHPAINLLYQRLFSGKLMLINDEPNETFDPDLQLTLSSFQEKFADLTTSDENLLFQLIRPNKLEFNFTRQHGDYMRFICNLNQFHDILFDPNIQGYFDKVFQADVYVDANLVLIENPDNLTAVIIKVILELSRHREFIHKVKHLTVKASDIGNMCVPQWSFLLVNFKSLVCLDLLQNLLRSNYEGFLDVWGVPKKFPDNLRSLNLDSNMLTYVSKVFLENLPDTLEELFMNQNDIEVIESCELGEVLPNLRRWELNYTKLRLINALMISSCKKGFTFEIVSTYLPLYQIEKLQQIAKQKMLNVVV